MSVQVDCLANAAYRRDGHMRDIFGGIGVNIATNTALFTGLDLGTWISDTLSLSTLPANLVAAMIATAFGLAITAASRLFKFSRAAGSAASEPKAVRELDRAVLGAAVLVPITYRRSLPVYPRARR
jgi:hypothetical protein